MGNSELDQIILKIVENERIVNQQAMAAALKARGLDVNQSTLSRHLTKLHILKIGGFYRRRVPQGLGVTQLALDVLPAPPNLLVVKTLPGHANAVGYHLERQDVVGMVGTVAGNDTLFVAVQGPEYLEPVQTEIVRIFRLQED